MYIYSIHMYTHAICTYTRTRMRSAQHAAPAEVMTKGPAGGRSDGKGKGK